MTPRCLSGPTCILPPLSTVVFTCPHCHRVWRKEKSRHGAFWRWDGREYDRTVKRE
jgi:predicted RNA-binding Zn-ribbon protein involved in translation (DUF1610 family)